MKRKSFLTAGFFALTAVLAGLNTVAVAQDKPLVVGVTPGPHAEIMEEVKKVAAKDGLEIKLVEFSNYVLLNQALDGKEIDANSFQHRPYLDTQVQNQGLNAVWAADTLLFPMGLYSVKIKDVSELKQGARIGLPNDPSNGGRALLLLQSANLIKLKPDVGALPSVEDIVENPLKLKLVEVDAALLPRTLDEMDASAINTNFAMSAGLSPIKDSILLEKKDSFYVNILVVRAEDVNTPAIQKLIKAYHSDEVKKFVEEKFQDAVIVAW